MNYMKQIAEMFDLEFNEPFKLRVKHEAIKEIEYLSREKVEAKEYYIDQCGMHEVDKPGALVRIWDLIITGRVEIVKRQWVPNDGEAMWTIKTIAAGVYQACEYPYDSKSVYCMMCVATGNCFKTKDDAEYVMPELLEKLKKRPYI